jgi:hypothetical protein
LEAAGSDSDLRVVQLRDRIAGRRQAADLRAGAASASNPPAGATTERQARQTPNFCAWSLDPAADTDAEDEALRLMDEAGARPGIVIPGT